MNKIILSGRLTKDPDVSVVGAEQKAKATFTLAVNRRFKDKNGQRQADFIDCVAWGNTATFLNNYVKKGHMVSLVGELQKRDYEKDGRKVYVTEVIVSELESLHSKSEDPEEQRLKEEAHRGAEAYKARLEREKKEKEAEDLDLPFEF